MNVSITTSGGSSPETFTNIIAVTVAGDKIMLTKKTVNEETTYNLTRLNMTGVAITRGSGS